MENRNIPYAIGRMTPEKSTTMNIKIATLALAATLFVLSCATDDANTASGNYTNPNGSSELAVLMNDLYREAETAKQKIALGHTPEWSVDAEKILTAAATEPEKVASAEYKAFAVSYLETVRMLKNASPAEVPAHFKAMTTSCMNCHNAICPGPTKRIRKLL
mgnify:FL=1